MLFYGILVLLQVSIHLTTGKKLIVIGIVSIRATIFWITSSIGKIFILTYRYSGFSIVLFQTIEAWKSGPRDGARNSELKFMAFLWKMLHAALF